jgi:hypothetical protein
MSAPAIACATWGAMFFDERGLSIWPSPYFLQRAVKGFVSGDGMKDEREA